jgi:hypothetical protein
MSLPALQPNGFLPPGIHVATLPDIIAQFGTGNPRRQELGARLQELLRVARSTGALRHAFIYGSFVTDKPFPRDLDVFLFMQEGFDRVFRQLPQLQQNIFEHDRARLMFEADVFWATEAIGLDELHSWLSVYQLSRDMIERGIVEVIFGDRDDGSI